MDCSCLSGLQPTKILKFGENPSSSESVSLQPQGIRDASRQFLGIMRHHHQRLPFPLTERFDDILHNRR